VRDALPALRFIFPNPEQFGKREIGKREIARQANQAIIAKESRKLSDLGLGALIAPDNRGPHYLVAGVQQNRTMHLPGKSHAPDGISPTP
jgi:hypothetical protein